MKRVLLLLLAIMPVFGLSTNVFATNPNTFYVNNAYFKGNGKYDIVVYDSNKDTLKLYVNDKNPAKAKVNKQGWATFNNIKLSGQSKLSFAKKVNLFKYTPISYEQYIYVDNDQIKLSDTGVKHSYGDFYNWLMSPLNDQSRALLGINGFKDSNRYQTFIDVCGYIDSNFGTQWTACMQKAYKDYLNPDTFVGDNWMGDYSTMVGDMNYAGPKNDEYNKDMQEAQKIYQRLAVTN